MTTDPTPPREQAPEQASPTASKPHSAHPPRRVRSFVVRAGRMGTGQIRALSELGPRYVLPFMALGPQGTNPRAEPEPPAPHPEFWTAHFGRQAPRVLEIGFGMGAATAQIAQSRPDTDFIGVEVHEPGVGALLKLMGQLGLSNIRILQHDAVDVLEHMIAPASLAGIHVFFPDPWHKKRHHKRRLIQPPLVALLASRLQPGGVLHCATDWQPYAEQMLQVLAAEPLLENTAGPLDGGYAPRPDYRPLTKFEQRGLRLGHGVWDVIFRRATPPSPPMP